MDVNATESVSLADDELLALQVGSEAAAFVELYERYLPPIQRYVRANVRDHATAEDLTAQIFLKSLRSARSFRGDGSYRSWLFQIARNTIASWKLSANRSEIPVERFADISLVKEQPSGAEDGDAADVVLEEIADLPRAQREVVALRYWQEMSIDEIAQETRRSTGAVRQLLHRARNRLRKKLSTKELIAGAAGATGASALALYSIKKRRGKKR